MPAYHKDTPAGFCALATCQQQLDLHRDRQKNGNWYRNCASCRSKLTASKHAFLQSRAKPTSRAPETLLRAIQEGRKLKDYFDALGLDSYYPQNGRIELASMDTTKLYQAIVLVTQKNSLPTDRGYLRAASQDPDILDKEIEQLLLEYGFIWSSGDQKVAQNDLNLDDAEDKELAERA